MGPATPLTITENQSMAVWNLMRLKELDDENAKLKKLFAKVSLENHVMKKRFAKKHCDGIQAILAKSPQSGFWKCYFGYDFKAIPLIINGFIAFIVD